MSSYLGSDVELECRVEASPRPVTVWLSGTGQKLEEVLDASEGQAGGSNASNEVIDYHLNPLNRSYGNQRLASNGYPGSKRKKYTFEEENDGYQTIMRLTIRRLDLMDFGSYKCVAKNSIGEKEGLVRLYGKQLTKKRGT